MLDIKEYECTVVSNNNVATFIKEFIVALPPGEHMNFIPGSYAQINIPKGLSKNVVSGLGRQLNLYAEEAHEG